MPFRGTAALINGVCLRSVKETPLNVCASSIIIKAEYCFLLHSGSGRQDGFSSLGSLIDVWFILLGLCLSIPVGWTCGERRESQYLVLMACLTDSSLSLFSWLVRFPGQQSQNVSYFSPFVSSEKSCPARASCNSMQGSLLTCCARKIASTAMHRW